MSWHGPSAPRVEGIATKSRVVASCASKPASTASRIRFVISPFIDQSWFWRGEGGYTAAMPSAVLLCIILSGLHYQRAGFKGSSGRLRHLPHSVRDDHSGAVDRARVDRSSKDRRATAVWVVSA